MQVTDSCTACEKWTGDIKIPLPLWFPPPAAPHEAWSRQPVTDCISGNTALLSSYSDLWECLLSAYIFWSTFCGSGIFSLDWNQTLFLLWFFLSAVASTYFALPTHCKGPQSLIFGLILYYFILQSNFTLGFTQGYCVNVDTLYASLGSLW